jgi:hypothetical protein
VLRHPTRPKEAPVGGATVLQKLADHIAACFERAAASERRASEATDPEVRQSYEEIARGWRHLAASYQFSELERPGKTAAR